MSKGTELSVPFLSYLIVIGHIIKWIGGIFVL